MLRASGALGSMRLPASGNGDPYARITVHDERCTAATSPGTPALAQLRSLGGRTGFLVYRSRGLPRSSSDSPEIRVPKG